jgi:hypothetical protein
MVQKQHGGVPSSSTIRPRLTEIASVFARYGNLTFGVGAQQLACSNMRLRPGVLGSVATYFDCVSRSNISFL